MQKNGDGLFGLDCSLNHSFNFCLACFVIDCWNVKDEERSIGLISILTEEESFIRSFDDELLPLLFDIVSGSLPSEVMVKKKEGKENFYLNRYFDEARQKCHLFFVDYDLPSSMMTI